MRFGLTIYKAQGLTLSAATAAAARRSAKELTGGRGVDLGPAAALLEEARARGLSVDEALRLLAQRCADDEGWRTKWRPRPEREGARSVAPLIVAGGRLGVKHRSRHRAGGYGCVRLYDRSTVFTTG